jgi:hypothetical protein
MTSYVYTANSAFQMSANLATDKIRIATTTSAIQYDTGSPKVIGSGTIAVATTSATVTGTSTQFTTEVQIGEWLCGNTSNLILGQVASIANNTSLTLTANATTTNASVAYAIAPTSDGFALATANSSIIPANTTLNSVIVGQGNVVSFLNVAGTAGAFSITELGMPHANMANGYMIG